MENASKALVMAGGILIALLIIGLLVYSFGTISGYFSSEQDVEAAEQLKVFNDQYESYNRKLLRGTDVISVMNKVLDNNDKYGINGYDEPDYIMKAEFILSEEIGGLQVGKTYNVETIQTIRNDEESFTEFKRKVFDCIRLQYNKTTGRVNYMLFEERQIDYGI